MYCHCLKKCSQCQTAGDRSYGIKEAGHLSDEDKSEVSGCRHIRQPLWRKRQAPHPPIRKEAQYTVSLQIREAKKVTLMLWNIYQVAWQPLTLNETKSKVMPSGWVDSRAKSSAINLTTQRCRWTQRVSDRSGRHELLEEIQWGGPLGSNGRPSLEAHGLPLSPGSEGMTCNRTQVTMGYKLYIWPEGHKFWHIHL